ncbi:MAG: iron donor protein CyaY [Lautropia sp.]|nr:iron donor protein CyaY [Lautropia sp.]
MSESTFSLQVAGVLDALVEGIEQAAEAADADIEVNRSGNVIELEFADRSQMVINSHEAAGEVWVASKRGGFHFRPAGEGRWQDTRSSRALLDVLADEIAFHAGQPLSLDQIRFPA